MLLLKISAVSGEVQKLLLLVEVKTASTKLMLLVYVSTTSVKLVLPVMVKKFEKRNRSRTHKLKSSYKVGLTARVESSDDKEILGEDASKHERRIDVIDDDDEITLDKGKGIMIEEPVKPKKKDQIRLDEEAALKLQAEFDKEERLAREEAKKNKKPILL
nr:hypothetical protein [Tanacetum cinerariifolium]